MDTTAAFIHMVHVFFPRDFKSTILCVVHRAVKSLERAALSVFVAQQKLLFHCGMLCTFYWVILSHDTQGKNHLTFGVPIRMNAT